ncbi:MAG: hypothetical protein ABSC49_02635 [Candidatus Microgenomates bacterium]|jgi:hypothetical protein
MELNPKYVGVINELLDKKNKEVTFSTHAKLVKIENEEGKSLLGILVDKSIAIPLSVNSESEDSLKTLVQTNLLELELNHGENVSQKACHLIGLPFNGLTDGFFSDGSAIGNETIVAVHIYPEGHFATQ